MVHEEDLLRERIHTLIHRENISRREFAIKVGKPVSNIYEILSGKRGIPKGLSTDIFTAFPQVNKDWLLFGEGSMYDGDETANALPKDTRPRLPRVLSEGHLVDYFEGEKRSLCQEKPIIKQFPDITLYTARYSFGSIAANELDIPEQTIGQCLGHSWSRHVTARYIAHDQRKVDDAVRRVVALISSA